MDREITLRHATTDDIRVIANLEKLIFSDPWTLDMVRADVESKISRYIVAEEITQTGPRIIGYLGYWLVFDECSINNVGVVPAMHRKGVGRLLMDEMIKETEQAGARVWVLEVRASNIAAMALYEKYDFKKVGVRKGYYENREDAVVMHRLKDI